jgi:sulfoxide reductase heme-binding subunit YedZ
MGHVLVALPVVVAADSQVRAIARLMARLAYLMICAALCWGLLISPAQDYKWFGRLVGHSGKTGAHLVFGTLALVFGGVHAAMFMFLSEPYPLVKLVVPLVDGGLARHALGIIGFELILLGALAVAVKRFLGIRRWLFVHRLVYPALCLIVLHSAIGAWVNGDFLLLAPAGVCLLLPVCWLLLRKYVAYHELRHENDPTELRVRRGYGRRRVAVSVSHQHCHRYGFCQQEAAQLFRLEPNGSLTYVARPSPDLSEQARKAARSCPMQAITVDEI